MDIAGYLDEVIAKFRTGQATEHSYRPALQRLFESIDPALTVINEPKRGDAGMPDFIFQRKDVPVGWVEAKDVDKDIIKLKGYSREQRQRYEAAFPNLIYTNGVDFEFIDEGKQLHFVSIADFVLGLQPKPDKFAEFERQLQRFAEAKPISIKSAAKLAEIMAAKAAIIKDEIGIALAEDPEFRSGLGGQFKSFKSNLLPALEPDEFADIYAETITYGMFAARFHDTDLKTFSRQEAMEDLPASNPFLKGLFEYIAGPGLPKRLVYIVDDLVQVMRASDPQDLFRDFGKFTARNDPFVHFYEDFLAAYNPRKRKSRGVWYTPEPVVDFIVRAVDDVLKTEFGLADGLADTSKVTVDWDTGQDDPKTGKPRTIKKEVHKVQILDPATGTGTFLAKAVQLISDRVKARAPGKWSAYVEEDLLPRLHGFELLMASYAMCHMKLDMLLDSTGYKRSTNPPEGGKRLSVWLTNALEPAEREVKDLFFQPLAEEARGASEVKRQMPIMCVIGNPPYSGSSQNMSDWARALVQPYKDGLNERKINLDDDYIKFIRLSESYIEKNGRGVVGFITNNSYLDGVTLRKMREHLLGTFDSIHVLNLFGDIRAAAAGHDENVFDITQGVAVVLMIKNGNGSGRLSYAEFRGARKSKNEFLWRSNRTIFQPLAATEPYFFFYPTNLDQNISETFKLDNLFLSLSSGIQTKNDAATIHFKSTDRDRAVEDFARLPLADLARAYPSKKVWSVEKAKADLASGLYDDVPILYRPFDLRHTVLTRKSSGFLGRPRFDVMRHFLARNMGLIVNKKFVGDDFSHVGVSPNPICHGTFYLGNRGQDFLCPLYLYPEDADLDRSVRLNLDPKLYAAICKPAGIDPADQARPDDDFRAATGEARPSEVKVFDYIYGVLHSPAYRETFAEFLKIDFPRIPYPPSAEVFRHVSEKGEHLRRLHLMEPAAIGETPYPFHGEGDDLVATGFPKFEGGKVHINKDQFFADVPAIAWGFHIGGYQPAQKWLKDRRGRSLSWDDIGHYQKIVKILTETDRVMKEIEMPLG